jgi:hypothetical protein
MAAATTSQTRKTATRKAAARKTAGRRTAARKPAATHQATASRKRPVAIDKLKVQETVKEVAYAQLGLYGRVYDEVNARMSRVRRDAPKQWGELVKRGEQVQRDLEKAQKELKRDLKQRVAKIETRVDVESRVKQVRSAMNKLAARVRKAA